VTSDAPPDSARRSQRRERAVLAALLVLAISVLGLYIRAYHPLSHADGLQHTDYLIKASHGELVRRGDRIGAIAMREMSCRGIDVGPDDYQRFYGRPKDLPACDAPSLDPARFPEEGFNTKDVGTNATVV